MAVISKVLMRSATYTCHETIHPWTPSCSKAAIDLARSVFKESLKIYSLMYLTLQILGKRFSPKDFFSTLHSIFASTCFMSTCLIGIQVFVCFYRKLFGRLFRFLSLLAGFTSCILAILIERKKRRGPLALYATYCASEALFNMLVLKGFVTPLPHGEVFLFATALSIYCYIMRLQGFTRDPVSWFIKYILGDEEAKVKETYDMLENFEAETISCDLDNNIITKSKATSSMDQFSYKRFHRWMEMKHRTCPHKFGCIHYSIWGFLRPFTVSFSAVFGIQCLSFVRKILIKPSNTFNGLNYKKALKFGLFLGGFCGTFKFINCIFRWMFDKDKAEFALPAAFIGGLFMKLFPSSRLALYLMWKTIEVSCNIGIKQNLIPQIPGFTAFLFAITGAVITHAYTFEPDTLPSSYLKFLSRLTENKSNEINRQLIKSI